MYIFITACKVVSLITLGSYSDCLTPTYAKSNAFDIDIAHTRGVNVVLLKMSTLIARVAIQQ